MNKLDLYYKNYISLGYFCDVAGDLEKIGLRDASYPFDWVISPFKGVIYAIDNKFKDFLDYENLSQNINYRQYYKDDKYDIYFFHDFSQYKSLSKQYKKVRNKYYRRINRLLTAIKEPTLFIRYISSEKVDEDGKSIELKWIEDNYQYVIDVIKRYNEQNEIIFIGNDDLNSKIINIYHTKNDENDYVSRSPIINNEELYNYFSNKNYKGKEENIKRYNLKQKKKQLLVLKAKNRLVEIMTDEFMKPYKHNKIYEIIDV